MKVNSVTVRAGGGRARVEVKAGAKVGAEVEARAGARASIKDSDGNGGNSL